MFSARTRDRLLADLEAAARRDPAVTGAALVGSAARGEVDPWSDVDLALRLAPGTGPSAAAEAWTRLLGGLATVADHLDLWVGPALYRSFLLEDSLQVDLSFWPEEEFASTGGPFALLFGSANEARVPTRPDPEQLVGWGWLHALHVRSALARGRHWQALQMLDGLRDQVVVLACLRHGVPASQGRGVDRLPGDLLDALRTTLAGRPEAGAIGTAFAAATALLLAEAAHVDPGLAARLRPPLTALLEPLA